MDGGSACDSGYGRTKMTNRDENLIRQLVGRCHHFNGSQNECCKAGVNYAELGGPIKGRALRMPCHDPSLFVKRREELGYTLAACSKLERATREEAEKEAAEIIEHGDRLMKVCAAAHADATAKGFKKGNGGADSMPCPTGCGGRLYYRVATYNGHMHAKCETEGCASWME